MDNRNIQSPQLGSQQVYHNQSQHNNCQPQGNHPPQNNYQQQFNYPPYQQHNPQQNNYPQNTYPQQYNYHCNNINQQQSYYKHPSYNKPKLVCPICGGNDFVYFDYSINEKPLWLTVIMILLIFVPIVGWIIDFALAFIPTRTIYTFATCTNCGGRENVQKNYNEYINIENEKFKQFQKEQAKRCKEINKIEKKNKRIKKQEMKKTQKKNI